MVISYKWYFNLFIKYSNINIGSVSVSGWNVIVLLVCFGVIFFNIVEVVIIIMIFNSI